MAPYYGSPFDNFGASPPPGKVNGQEEVIFSLTERLRESESEIRHLRQEKSELENQLILRGNPIQLDVAYEELLAHLKQRELDFRSEAKTQEERQQELERENRRLKDKVHASRKRLDEQEKNISIIERETDGDLEMMQQRLHVVMGESQEKDRQIALLEDVAENLTEEVGRAKEKEEEDVQLSARLGERIESYRRGQEELSAANEELQRRVQTQHVLLTEKEDEIIEMEKFRDQRENELIDDLERMRRRYSEIVQAQRYALEEREEEIHLLYRQCDKYEDIIDEAEYITHEQRADLRTKKKEIEELSMAIERAQNSGLFGKLDKMCSTNSLESLRNKAGLID